MGLLWGMINGAAPTLTFPSFSSKPSRIRCQGKVRVQQGLLSRLNKIRIFNVIFVFMQLKQNIITDSATFFDCLEFAKFPGT